MSKELEKTYADIKQIIDQEIDLFNRAIDMALTNGVSACPILVFGPEELSMEGEILKKQVGVKTWKICFSTLEKFLEMGLIRPERAPAFKANYKNPETHFCLFVVTNNGATFAFLDR